MILNGVQIPEFRNFDEVTAFIDANSDKLYLHFLEDDNKIQRNTILSKNEEENTEYNEVEVKHCMRCEAISDTITAEDWCEDCDGDHEEDDEDW